MIPDEKVPWLRYSTSNTHKNVCFPRFGVKEPRHSEAISDKKCYLYRSTRSVGEGLPQRQTHSAQMFRIYLDFARAWNESRSFSMQLKTSMRNSLTKGPNFWNRDYLTNVCVTHCARATFFPVILSKFGCQPQVPPCGQSNESVRGT